MQQTTKGTSNYLAFYGYQLGSVPTTTVFLVDAQKKNSTYNRQFSAHNAESGSTAFYKITFTEDSTQNLSGGTVTLEEGTYDVYIYSSTTGNITTSSATFLYEETMIVNPMEHTYITP